MYFGEEPVFKDKQKHNPVLNIPGTLSACAPGLGNNFQSPGLLDFPLEALVFSEKKAPRSKLKSDKDFLWFFIYSMAKTTF